MSDETPESIWKERFACEWRVFCLEHNLPVRVCNAVLRATHVVLKERVAIEAKIASYGDNPSRRIAQVYQDWARQDLQLFDAFHSLDPFDEWLRKVHDGKFPVRTIRNFGRGSEQMLFAAINKHCERLATTPLEYGYA